MASGARHVGTITQTVAAELRAEVARGLVRKDDLAARSGVPVGTLSKILRGVAPIDMEQYGALCIALGVDAAELFARARVAVRAQWRDELGMTPEQVLAERVATSPPAPAR